MHQEPTAPKIIINQVVSDGVYFYAACTDDTLWFAPFQFPLSWRQLPSPTDEHVHWIGVTLGTVRTLPDEVFFIVTEKSRSLWFWNGHDWNQNPQARAL